MNARMISAMAAFVGGVGKLLLTLAQDMAVASVEERNEPVMDDEQASAVDNPVAEGGKEDAPDKAVFRERRRGWTF